MGDSRFKVYFIVTILFIFLMIFFVSAQDSSSANYKSKSSITSNTGGNSTSSNFIANTIIGIISGNIFSNSFNNYVGFFQATLSDSTPPHVIFVNPTPANATIRTVNSILVNVSVNDTNYVSSFIDSDNSLISWWRMDDLNSTGGVVDYTGKNNGTVVGNAVQTQNGKIGSAFSFDGDGADYISIPYVQNLNFSKYSNVTISAWIKPYDTGESRQTIIGATNGAGTQGFGLKSEYDNSRIGLRIGNGSSGEVKYSDSSVLSLEQWNYITIIYNIDTKNIKFYVNSIQKGDQNYTIDYKDHSVARWIGRASWSNADFNGSIDDLVIFNRSLSANEVLGLYANTSSKYYFNNFTGLADGNHYFKAYGQDLIGNVNSTETRTITVDTNLIPYNGTVLILNSTLGLNRTLEDLNLQTTLLDHNPNNLNVTVFWYNNSVKHLTLMYNSSYSNGTTFVSTLGNGNTTKGQNWSVGLIINDGIASFMVNSTNLTILNTPPNATLIAPIDNSITFNRTTQTFTWAVSDVDGDTPTQSRINISLIASSSCTDSYFDGSDTYQPGSLESFSINSQSLIFNCLSDNNDYYEWSVSATDGASYGPYTSPFNLSIQALLSTTMNISVVEFGNLGYLKNNDTTTNSPKPLIIINQGNALSNVGVHATNLWQSISNPSTYYRFKFDNATTNGISENGSFIWAQSTVTFTDVPLIQTTGLTDLNYSDATDSSEIDINVTVPSTEGPGVRTSTITFTVSLGDGDTY